MTLKRVFKIHCVILFAFICSLLLVSCGDDSSKASTPTVSSSQTDSKPATKTSTKKESETARLTRERDQAQKEANILKSQLDQSKQDLILRTYERDQAKQHFNYVLYIAIGIVVIILAFLCFILRPPKKKMNIELNTTNELHCPRCGAIYSPGETICKECKLHL